MEADNQEVETEFDGGWVKLHRQWRYERVFQCEHLWRLFTYLLFKARHSPGGVSLSVAGNRTTTWLQVGQLIVGRRSLGEDLGWPPSTAWDRLQRLEEMGMISTESDNHKSVVTIMNFQGSRYVEPEDVDKQVTTKRQPVSKQSSTSRQPGDTNREGIQSKNEKKVNTERGRVGTPTRQEIEEEYLSYIKEINEPNIRDEMQKLEAVEVEIKKLNDWLEKSRKEVCAMPNGSERDEAIRSHRQKEEDKFWLQQEKGKIEREIESKSVKVLKEKMDRTIRNFLNHLERGKFTSDVWKPTLRSWILKDIEAVKPVSTYGQRISKAMGGY